MLAPRPPPPYQGHERGSVRVMGGSGDPGKARTSLRFFAPSEVL